MAGLNLFTNNAATTLASSINSSVTSLTVAASTGGLFPNPTAGQYFYATLQNTTGTTIEIVKVTARSTDTFTIVRAQDNTTASAFTAGDKVELRATAADLNNFGQLDSTNTWALAQTFSSPIAATSGGTAQSTYTTGDIIYASGTNTLSKLAIGTAGQALTVSGGVPAWAAAGGSTSLTTTSFTATAGQTSFTVSYTPSLLQGVYRNGVKLDPADYTASSGTAVVLSAAAALNDNIQVQFFTALSTLATPLAISLGGTGATSLAAATIATQGYTTTATAAGTTTLTVSSTQLQFFTGTTTQTVVLPVASTLTAGQRFEIHNNSTGSVTVNSSGSNLVATVLPNTTTVLTCILTSGTTAASWDADIQGFTTSVSVANGGTGNTSATAYALLAGGTTSTGAFQSLASVGTTGQILTSNGAGALPTFQTAAGGGGLGGITVFTASGTFTIPTGKTVVKVTVVGGGGGGGNGGPANAGGGAGGGGIKYLTGLTPGNTLTVTRGAGGGSAAAGASSTVTSGTQSITTITATGGSAGGGGSMASGGAGGSASGSDLVIAGQVGENGMYFNGDGGQAGRVTGNGGSSLLGFGGAGYRDYDPNGSVAGTAGSLYGGGGGGGPAYSTAYAGANGVIVFEY